MGRHGSGYDADVNTIMTQVRMALSGVCSFGRRLGFDSTVYFFFFQFWFILFHFSSFVAWFCLALLKFNRYTQQQEADWMELSLNLNFFSSLLFVLFHFFSLFLFFSFVFFSI